MIATDAMIDADSMLSAKPTAKIAITLAWRNHFDLRNKPSLRQEWARAFGRHALMHLSTALPN